MYYGWVILLAATFGMFMTTPGQMLGVSVFLDRIVDVQSSFTSIWLATTGRSQPSGVSVPGPVSPRAKESHLKISLIRAIFLKKSIL